MKKNKAGWIYIITNKALPDLIKIGFTEREGSVRAKELSVTGLPYKYDVAYECKAYNAYSIEQKVHRLLKEKNEGKEWFKVSLDEGIAAIRKAGGDHIVLEKNHITQKEWDRVKERSEWEAQCERLQKISAGEDAIFRKSKLYEQHLRLHKIIKYAVMAMLLFWMIKHMGADMETGENNNGFLVFFLGPFIFWGVYKGLRWLQQQSHFVFRCWFLFESKTSLADQENASFEQRVQTFLMFWNFMQTEQRKATVTVSKK